MKSIGLLFVMLTCICGCGASNLTTPADSGAGSVSVTVNTTVRKTGQYPESFEVTYGNKINEKSLDPASFKLAGKAGYWGSDDTRDFECSFSSVSVDNNALTLVPEAFPEKGHVDYLINNALPMMKGIDECSFEEFQYALSVGVTAPFYLTKLLSPYFAKGAAVINMASSRDRMSQPQTESYSAAKGGIAALTHSMAISLAGKARVNSISPGWIDTTGSEITGPDAVQQPVGRVGKPEDIAEMVMFLCSDRAGFITGENICIDGGMTKLMIYHGEHGWDYSKGE